MEYPDDMKRRLRRIEGQIGGVLRMMEEEKNCKDVVSQLSAIRSAVDRATAYIVSRNLEQCIREELKNGPEGDTEKLVQEAINLLVKSR
ncbi:MAG: metal-sensitive transcriptional regulator [Firmicutes bacterium]|uniref:DNA-binding transcriptional regulator, FrmR family n=1 Tax=Melghirimyces thermohalophilus TaxID=1236220 RepID=A0A1G6LAJ3_9BACL|nr:metal-sensitive transcriptional regulator [Melghirimyces thermohalophilus]MDA8352421.1 metal-sensitive transcriptional regulator [Bacillota bacterium]SDC40077.1 DNA-binding transcriptional regulator, FrmR family [Melghirimyces thermohalophilus]